jgi:hypothetical protein
MELKCELSPLVFKPRETELVGRSDPREQLRIHRPWPITDHGQSQAR